MSDQIEPIVLGGAFAAIVLLYILYKRRKPNQQESNFSYVAKTDPNAQAMYEDKLKEKDPLTKDERIELSWQFLYDITDIVLNKFSPEDKKAIQDLGTKIVSAGGGYDHVVEYGIKKEKKKSRLVEEPGKDQKQEIGR
jgi:hypothetical protein